MFAGKGMENGKTVFRFSRRNLFDREIYSGRRGKTGFPDFPGGIGITDEENEDQDEDGEEEPEKKKRRPPRRVSAEERREWWVLWEGGDGMTFAEMARQADRDEKTVRKHVLMQERKERASMESKLTAFEAVHGGSPAADPAAQDHDQPVLVSSRSPEDKKAELDQKLDAIFSDEEEIAVFDDNWFGKMLYKELRHHKVKEEDAEILARDANAMEQYHNEDGLYHFLFHSGLKTKARIISQAIFGRINKQQRKGGNPPGYIPPGYTQPPGWTPPGYHHGQQPPGYVQQQPGYQWPPFWPPPPQQNSGATKDEVRVLITDLQKDHQRELEKVNETWQAKWDKRDEKETRDAETQKLLDMIEKQNETIEELRYNPPGNPPGPGHWEEVEEPEFDKEGNVKRIRKRFERVEDPETTAIKDRVNQLETDLAEERKAIKDLINNTNTQIKTAELDKVAAEFKGEKDILVEKRKWLEDHKEEYVKELDKIHKMEMENAELKHKLSVQETPEMALVSKKVDVMEKGLEQAKGLRKDLMQFFMVMSGRTKPGGTDVEQWTEEDIEKMWGE